MPRLEEKVARVVRLLKQAEQEIEAIGDEAPAPGEFTDPEGEEVWPEVRDSLAAVGWHLRLMAPALEGALDARTRKTAC